MNIKLSNQILLDKKRLNLNKFKNDIKLHALEHSFSCIYHGINLNFRTNSTFFINSLKSFIPTEWISALNGNTIIYLISPAEFGYSSEEWSDEFSQDCLSFEDNTLVIQRDFAACLSGNQVFLICEDSVGDGFYNFLRWYLSEKLMGLNKYVLHASCVLDKKQNAHLFLGHSGAGKTTITKLATPRLVLGDDMNLISFSNKQFFVEAGAIGGQFNSMIGYDKKVPVSACYWLKQAEENKCIILQSLIANQKLLASFANLHWPTLPMAKVEQLMNFSEQVIQSTKFYELNFKNDAAIWEYLDP